MNIYIAKLKTYLYILQSAEYDIGAFWKWLKKTKGKLERQKKELIWTAKAKILFKTTLYSWAGGLLLLTIIFFTESNWQKALFLTAITAIIWQFLLPLFLTASTIAFNQSQKIYLYFYLQKAKNKLNFYIRERGLIVIGIAGSFGKTSVKEFLTTILKEKYNVFFTPENINTPIGIGRLILNNLNEHYEVFIAEMGAYEPGDIKKLCALVNPQVGILTGINESHLEKFKTLTNTIKTKFELIESLPADGLALINGDNFYVRDNYKKHIRSEVKIYSLGKSDDIMLTNYQQLETDSKFAIIRENKEVEFNVSLLGKHNVLNILPAILVAERFGLTLEQIKKGVTEIKPVPHRLQPILGQNNILIIDDSYNGNPDGALAAIEVLKNYKNRRKIYATPGLVELGKSKEEAHRNIGSHLAEAADLVLLIQNSNTEFIQQGLKDKKYPEDKIKTYQTSQHMHDDLKNILKSDDVILFQNDWPDNYT